MSAGARVISIIVVVLILIVLALRFFAPSAFFGLFSPFFSFGSGISTGSNSFFAVFENAASLRAELDAALETNRALTNEHAILTARIADLEGLVGEEAFEEKGVIAGVIARPPLAPYDMLIIGAGSRDGIHEGVFVTAEGGVPVGTVANVSNDVSHILLFSSPERLTDAWLGVERVPITLTGKGSGAFFVEVANDVPVVVGDTVYVAGPGARPIGTVSRIDTDPSSPRTRLRVQALVNPFALTLVRVQR